MAKVIAEIAGRDSLAAVIKLAQENFISQVFPTFVKAPTEYGDPRLLEGNLTFLRKRLEPFDVEVKPLETFQDNALWAALNGRFLSRLINRFGFFTPCFGCHLYFHLMRIPLAQRECLKVVVSGERESHAGKVKVNQSAIALDAYAQVMKKAGFELIFPLRYVEREEELLSILGDNWREGERQFSCVFQGNYSHLNVEQKRLKEFFEVFLIPVGESLAEMVWQGEPSYFEAVSKVIEAI